MHRLLQYVQSRPVWQWWIVFATACVLGYLTIGRAQHSPDIKPPADRRGMPALPVFDAKGQFSNTTVTPGEVTIVNILGTRCKTCQTELWLLSEFRERFHRRGLDVVGIIVDNSTSGGDEPPAHPAVGYPVLIATPEIERTLGPFGLPLTLFVDRRGRIAATVLGIPEKPRVVSIVTTLLAESNRD